MEVATSGLQTKGAGSHILIVGVRHPSVDNLPAVGRNFIASFPVPDIELAITTVVAGIVTFYTLPV